MKRWLRLGVGWAFVVLGLVGLVLPILQGVLFLAIGLAILSRDSPFIRRQLDRLRVRYPRLFQQIDVTRDKASGWARRRMGRSP